MANQQPDFAQAARPLVDYIKSQIPCNSDLTTQILTARLIAGLPTLFTWEPEILTQAIAAAGSQSDRLKRYYESVEAGIFDRSDRSTPNSQLLTNELD